MKKLFAILIIFLSTSLIIVACGNDNEVSEDDTNVEEDLVEDNDEPAIEPEPDLDNEDTSGKDDGGDIDSLLSKSENIPEYYYEYNISGKDIESNQEMLIKFWNTPKRARMEMNVENEGNMVIIINREESINYIYYPDQNMAIKMPSTGEVPMMDTVLPKSEDGELEDESLKYYLEDIKNSEIEVIGDEKYEGYDVKVVKLGDGSDYSKVWISKEFGYPFKIEVFVGGEIQSTMAVKNFKEGPFEDSLFEIPEGIEVQDLTNMGN